MKKLFILLIAFIPIISFSQVNTGMALGYDTHGRAVAALSVGATIGKILEIQGEVRPSLSRSAFAHNYIGGRIGLNLINSDLDGLSIIPGAGYFYDLKSQDKPDLNKYYWGAFLKSIIMVTENGGLFVDAMYINKSVQASIGIHFKFTRQDRPY